MGEERGIVVNLFKHKDKQSYQSYENNVNGGFADRLFFKDRSLEIAKNDIVVFVGPNNSGKSRILKDMYSLMDSYLKQSDGEFSDTLFIHCGGKDRMPKIIKALKSLDINVKVIADLDVLKSKETLYKIISNMGMEEAPFKQKYESLKAEIFKNGDASTIKKSEIESVIKSGEGENLELTQIRQIKQLFKRMNKWDELKSTGINKMDDINAKDILKELVLKLKDNSIYLVPVGELENFVPLVSGHGNEWVDKVLNQYPDFSDPVYNELTSFINDLDI